MKAVIHSGTKEGTKQNVNQEIKQHEPRNTCIHQCGATYQTDILQTCNFQSLSNDAASPQHPHDKWKATIYESQ